MIATTGFLGLQIGMLNLDQAVDTVDDMGRQASFSYVVTPNVDHMVKLARASSDRAAAALRAAYDDAALVLCDSRVLARLARLSGLKLPVTPGSDLTAALFERRRLDGRVVAIIGGTERLPHELAARFPDVEYRQHRPPMGVLGDAQAVNAIVDFVAKADADVVLFAIGAPQSEIAARACRSTPDLRGVGLCVGASLEFLVNEKRRAPRWLQRLGMEWAFRLASEPRRLWRRYLIEGPRIFILWWRWRSARSQ